jgi:ABC-type molybdate transport system substrate-binding protein
MPIIGWGAPATPLRVAVQSGFKPAFVSLLPQLEQQLHLDIILSDSATPQLFAAIAKPATPYDVLIGNNDGTFNRLEDQKRLMKGSITPLVSSQIVLWCPSNHVEMRVSISETLRRFKHITLALPPKEAPATRAILPFLPSLDSSIKLIYSKNTPESWRLAYQQQADCAVTLKSLIARESVTQYRPFPHQVAHITGVISADSHQVAAATQLLQKLNSPIIRAKLQLFGYQ